MIRSTFQILRGIGPSREKDLWAAGFDTWDSYLSSTNTILSVSQDKNARIGLQEAKRVFQARDLRRLVAMVPSREYWRFYPEFKDEVVFFDIETDGTSMQTPTVVSLFHSQGFEVFIQGRNLAEVPQALARWPVWITFNGVGFDAPVLASYFGELPKPALHLDLRFVCRQVGLSGGLKKIEEKVGISRPQHLHGVNGLDAIFLWKEFQRNSDVQCLRKLVEYNIYDTIQLRSLVEIVFNMLVDSLGFQKKRIPVFERGDILYDASRYILNCTSNI